MLSKRSLDHTRHAAIMLLIAPTPVGVGVGTYLILGVHQTLPSSNSLAM